MIEFLIGTILRVCTNQYSDHFNTIRLFVCQICTVIKFAIKYKITSWFLRLKTKHDTKHWMAMHFFNVWETFCFQNSVTLIKSLYVNIKGLFYLKSFIILKHYSSGISGCLFKTIFFSLNDTCCYK